LAYYSAYSIKTHNESTWLGAIHGQIQKRGRDYEDNIRLDYLKRLNEFYNNFIDNYKDGKVLIIDIDQINFVDNPDDLAKVIELVTAEVNGLF
jgi:deoxyadenosine/deoxycytidine kinase